MNYKVLYSNNNKQFKDPVRRDDIENMGNWRSRWERKRELDKKNGVFINKIYTRPTDKDYIFTKAYGYDNNYKLFFKIVPAEDLQKPKLKDNNSCNSSKVKATKKGSKYICNDPNSKWFNKVCKQSSKKVKKQLKTKK